MSFIILDYFIDAFPSHRKPFNLTMHTIKKANISLKELSKKTRHRVNISSETAGIYIYDTAVV